MIFGEGLRGLVHINNRILAHWFQAKGNHGLLAMYDRLVGGALSSGSMLTLGIMPYLSARTFRWICGLVSPRVARMENERDGRLTLRAITRVVTLVLSLIQSYGFARFAQSIPGVVRQPGAAFVLETMLILTLGALAMLWIGENATESDASIELLQPRAESPRANSTEELLLNASPRNIPTRVTPHTPMRDALRVRTDTPI